MAVVFEVFILAEYTFQTNIDSVFHIDSDNVLLGDISNYNFQKIAYCIPPNIDENYMSGSIHSGLLNKEFLINLKIYIVIFLLINLFTILLKTKLNFIKILVMVESVMGHYFI